MILDGYIKYLCPETVELDVLIPATNSVEHQVWKVPDKCRKVCVNIYIWYNVTLCICMFYHNYLTYMLAMSSVNTE